MKKSWIAAAIVLLLLPLGLARAAEFAGNQNGDIIVPASETHHNLYTAGQNITIDAPTLGDLAVAGQTVIANGSVEGSLFAAGEQVNVRGNVGDHVRIADNRVTISGTVGGDLFVAGQEITISPDAVINGGFYAAGSSITINGIVKGDVRATGSTVEISGKTGPLNIYGDVTLKKTAAVNGDFRYHAKTKATVERGATITGSTHFTEVKNQTNRIVGLLGFAALAGLIGWIILGLLIIFLLTKFAQAVIDRALGTPAAAAGYGLASLFLIPIAGVILAITIIGLPIAFLLGLTWLLLVMLGSLMGKVALGAILYKLFTKSQTYTVNWITLLIGLVAAALVGYVPILGGLVKFVFLLIGVGALTQVLFGFIRPQPTLLSSKA